MTIYGFTTVDTGGYITLDNHVRESFTHLFRSLAERDDFAKRRIRKTWIKYYGDNDVDEDGQTFDEVLNGFSEGVSTHIALPYSHIQFEAFEQEV